jgi:hypothetical protein
MWIVVPSAVGGALVIYGVLYASMPRRNELIEEIR